MDNKIPPYIQKIIDEGNEEYDNDKIYFINYPEVSCDVSYNYIKEIMKDYNDFMIENGFGEIEEIKPEHKIINDYFTPPIEKTKIKPAPQYLFKPVYNIVRNGYVFIK